MPERTEVNSALYKAADRNTRRSGLRAVLFLLVALLAAVGSAMLLTRYMERRTQAARVPTRAVMVAAADLPIGTELHPEHLAAIEWPATSVPDGCFGAPKELEGRTVAVRIYKGEPILPPLLADSGARGLSALLPPGYRAAAVRVDDIVGVAGFIHPGDTVDVLVTMRTEGSASSTAARVILQKIKVLAVGKDLDVQQKAGAAPVPATVATLLVTAPESERLALASAQGKILLTLRGAADAEFVQTKGVNPNALLVTAEPPPPPAPPPPRSKPSRVKTVKAAPPEAPRAGQVVEILRGDVFERRDFQKETRP